MEQIQARGGVGKEEVTETIKKRKQRNSTLLEIEVFQFSGKQWKLFKKIFWKIFKKFKYI